jgi:ABC-type glycerol-3-phosphate transport system substrate-binding protein
VIRSRRLVAFTIVLAVLLAACGSSKKKSPASTATTLPSLQGQSLEVAGVWTGQEQASFQAVLDAFATKTGATVHFTSTGDDIATVLGTRIEGKNPPDVALLPQPGLITELANRGALIDLGPIVGKAVDDNYAPLWRQLGSVNGKLSGVFFKAANKSTVWYNTHVFTDAGVNEPATWDDFTKTLQTIADSGIPPLAMGGADGWTLTDWFENVYIRSAGAANYDKLTKHEIPWTDQSVKDALKILSDIWSKPQFLAGGTQGAVSTAFPQSVALVFGQKKAAIVMEGDFVAATIAKETQAKVGVDAKFFSFPSIKGSDPSVVGGGDAAALMKDTAAGRALIQFLATPEAAEVWVKRGGFTSPNKKVNVSLYPDDVTRKSATDLVGAKTFRFDMSDLEPAAFGGTPGQGEWAILQDFLRKPADIDGTASKLEAAAAKAFTK